MTGNVVSIDFSVSNVWFSWRKFRRGKRRSAELEHFTYYLENNLFYLSENLKNDMYRHGGYKIFYITDSKKRRIAVARIRDRVVHRLLYEYLVPMYDPTFIPDAWSCRKGKGLFGAIKRTQQLLHWYPHSFVWRADVVKFFDNVRRDILFKLLERKIFDSRALRLLKEVIESSGAIRERERERKPGTPRKGIPIGNLTSQIFANIYLNEFDQFMKNTLKPHGYVRYGDDFIVIAKNRESAECMRRYAAEFLLNNLSLTLHNKNNVIVHARHGLHFLGMRIYPTGRTLNKRNLARIENRLTIRNISSYGGLVKNHMKPKDVRTFEWQAMEIIKNFDHVS